MSKQQKRQARAAQLGFCNHDMLVSQLEACHMRMDA
jgi:hypothetical protein